MESKVKFKPNPDDRLMDQVREILHYYHYAYKTEQSYPECCINNLAKKN